MRRIASPHERIIDAVADILDQGEPTPFRFEALCRAVLRAGFVLRGTPWARADNMSAQIVAAAFAQLGVDHQVEWKMGQPEWTQEGHAPVERTRCIECHRGLAGDQTKFCGALCAWAYHARLDRLRAQEDAAAVYDLVAKRTGSLWN